MRSAGEYAGYYQILPIIDGADCRLPAGTSGRWQQRISLYLQCWDRLTLPFLLFCRMTQQYYATLACGHCQEPLVGRTWPASGHLATYYPNWCIASCIRCVEALQGFTRNASQALHAAYTVQQGMSAAAGRRWSAGCLLVWAGNIY